MQSERYWTHTDTETLKELVDKNVSWHDIANRLHRTRRSVQQRWQLINEGRPRERYLKKEQVRNEDKDKFSRDERATAKLLVLLRKHHDFDVRIPAHVKPEAVIIPPAEQTPEPILDNDALPAKAVESYRTHDDAIAKIKRIVGKATGVSIKEMNSPDRGQTVVRSRQIAIYLSKQLTGRSWNEVARRFNRDHTTAIHAIAAIEKQIKSDPLFAAKVDRLMEEARAAA